MLLYGLGAVVAGMILVRRLPGGAGGATSPTNGTTFGDSWAAARARTLGAAEEAERRKRLEADMNSRDHSHSP